MGESLLPTGGAVTIGPDGIADILRGLDFQTFNPLPGQCPLPGHAWIFWEGSNLILRVPDGSGGCTDTIIGTVSTNAPEQFSFVAADWGAGIADEVTLVFNTAAGAGQIGPHNQGTGKVYLIQTYEDKTGGIFDQVLIETEINVGNGFVTIKKSAIAPAFDGRIVIRG